MCEAASPPIGKVVLKGYWREKVSSRETAANKPVPGRITLFIRALGDMGLFYTSEGDVAYFYLVGDTAVMTRKGEVRVAKKVEEIKSGDELIAVIVPADFGEPGVHFFTPQDAGQQLAYVQHEEGVVIDAHVHNEVERSIKLTSEAVFVKKGRLRVDFYAADHQYLLSRVVEAGAAVLQLSGGHGFKVLDEAELVVVKQGPYAGRRDKTRFRGVGDSDVRLF